MKRALLLIATLATVASTYALPTGEFPIALRPIGAAPYERRHPEVAATSDVYLAVWEDSRENPNQPSLWAARVTLNGTLLDPTGIRITSFAPNSLIGTHLRSVATDGTDFLIAWSDDENHLRLAKITADGRLVAFPDPHMGADAATVVWVGDMYVVFLTDPPTPPFQGSAVGVGAIDRSGEVFVRASLGLGGVIALSAVTNNDKSVIYLGWLEAGDAGVHVAPILANSIRTGSVSPPADVAPTTGAKPTLLSIATNGVDVMAAWLDEGPNPPVYRAQLLQNNGVEVAPAVTLANASQAPIRPAVAWNGSEYVVAYQDGEGTGFLRRFAGDGTGLGGPLTISSGFTGVAAASHGDDTLVVWTDRQGTTEQTNANLLAPAAQSFHLPAPVLLSSSFPDRSDATVVWRGTHYLAAWRDVADITRAVVGRFSVDGQPLDGAGINLSQGAAAAPPALASNGRTAVVAWLDREGVASSLVDETGHILRRSFNFPGGLPAVNWNGTQYLVAWRNNEGQLVALRLNNAGDVVDNLPVNITTITGDPLVGWTGNSYVVIYTQTENCFPICAPKTTLWAQFVSPTLTPIGSRIQLGEATVGTPAIAAGAAGVLVVWPRTVGDTTTLRATRIVNGSVLDPINGFAIGAASFATAYATANGWGVVSGPFVWSVSANGGVSPRVLALPFVPVGAHSSVVLGGPEPLAVYRRPPVGTEQMMQVMARYITGPLRTRAARH